MSFAVNAFSFFAIQASSSLTFKVAGARSWPLTAACMARAACIAVACMACVHVCLRGALSLASRRYHPKLHASLLPPYPSPPPPCAPLTAAPAPAAPPPGAAGCLKNAAVVWAGVSLGDHLTPKEWAGYALSLAGFLAYTLLRSSAAAQQAAGGRAKQA